jgi:hypothetical protein
MTASDGRTWRETYDRMKRTRARLRESEPIADQLRDDFYHFFLHCFHLKDWLKNDVAVPKEVGGRAEQLFDKSKAPSPLVLCADIANGVKHLHLDKPRVDPDALLSAAVSAFQPSAFQADAYQTTGMIVLKIGGDRLSALVIADKCIAAWDRFLRDEGLL